MLFPDTSAALRAAAQRVRWYHSYQFPDGTATKGYDPSSEHWSMILTHLPDLQGKSVLDIGTWDGYFAHKCKESGASRVLATDHFCWSGPGWGNKDGFDVARHYYPELEIEQKDIDPSEIRPETVGRFDIVLFLGVLYHRPDYFQSLLNAASVCKGTLVVETMLDIKIDQTMALSTFYPSNECNGDPTNWFVPNRRAVIDMLRACRFTDIVDFQFVSGHPRGMFYATRS